jgi:ferric-dicitrate binding protein FerR (iron transport regulator)
MKPVIKELYKKYLYGHITKVEFGEMKYEINKITNEELAEFEHNDWNDFITREKMLESRKVEIKNNLKFYASQQNQNNSKNLWLKIAAVVLPVIFVSTIFLMIGNESDSKSKFAIDVDRGSKATIMLPDESKVWINSNTNLQYVANESNIREVKLNGEAYFMVKRDASRPFILAFEDIKIEVVGTSFNVKAYKNNETIETSLVEGKVKITGNHLSGEYLLKPNEKAIYNKKSNNLTIISTTNEIETAWKNNELKFDSEKFSDVMNRVEDWYGITIVNKYPQINNDLITGSFKNQGIESVLDILSTQYNIKYTRSGNVITISPIK